jgi:hypothetical protein
MLNYKIVVLFMSEKGNFCHVQVFNIHFLKNGSSISYSLIRITKPLFISRLIPLNDFIAKNFATKNFAVLHDWFKSLNISLL